MKINNLSPLAKWLQINKKRRVLTTQICLLVHAFLFCGPRFSRFHKWWFARNRLESVEIRQKFVCRVVTYAHHPQGLTLGFFNLESAFYVILSNAICCTMLPGAFAPRFSALVCCVNVMRYWSNMRHRQIINLNAKFRLFALHNMECHRYRVRRGCYAGKSLRGDHYKVNNTGYLEYNADGIKYYEKTMINPRQI